MARLSPCLCATLDQLTEVITTMGMTITARRSSFLTYRLMTSSNPSRMDDWNSEHGAVGRRIGMPKSPVGPGDVEAALQSEALRPPGVDVEAKDRGTYGIRVPGYREAIRVTCQPTIFEAHFESHQLALPDSRVFRRLVEAAGVSGPNAEPLSTDEIEAARRALSQPNAVASSS